MIERRSENGCNYGVVLLPEGLIEFVPEVGSLIGEINDILAQNTGDDHLNICNDRLSPQSRQVPKSKEGTAKQSHILLLMSVCNTF